MSYTAIMILFMVKDFKHPKENIASGSGVINANDGYIITNRHVINNARNWSCS